MGSRIGQPAEQQHLERVGRALLAVGGPQRERVAGPEDHQLVVGHRPALVARVALAEST